METAPLRMGTACGSVLIMGCVRPFPSLRNAPQLELPDGVGFSVGAQSGIKYIVAQVCACRVCVEGGEGKLAQSVKLQPAGPQLGIETLMCHTGALPGQGPSAR